MPSAPPFSKLSRWLSPLLKTQGPLSEEEIKRGHRLLVTDGLCSMSMGTLWGGPFLIAFAVGLGATNYDIGLIASLGFFCQPLQLLALYFLMEFPKRRAIVFLGAAASRFSWVFLILIPFLFLDRGKTFFIQWLFIATLFGVIPGPAWNSWIRDLIPAEKMGKIFSKRMRWGMLFSMILTLAGGQFVDHWKNAFPDKALYAYSLLFLLGLLFGLIGLWMIFKMPEPTMSSAPQSGFFKQLTIPWQDANFRQLLWFTAAWSFVITLATPFFVIYMLNRIGLSMGWVTLLTVVSLTSHFLFLKIWGKMADRFSNKSVLAASGPLVLIATLAWCFTTLPEKHYLTLPLLFAIHVLSGASMAGVSLAANNISLKLSPQGLAHVYMTVLGLVGAATGAVAPLLGGVLADFFAARELSISLNWAEPSRQISIYAVNFRALDFLFFLSFLLGLYALHRLSHVKEEGEITEGQVLDEVVDEVVLPFRTLSSMEGLRRLSLLPLASLQKVSQKSKNLFKGPS